MKRYFVIAEGQVQGVGFRYFVLEQASKYNCTGYAKNLDNGMVEIQIQGNEQDLDKVLKIIKEGNRFIIVNNLSLKEIPTILESSFIIKYY